MDRQCREAHQGVAIFKYSSSILPHSLLVTLQNSTNGANFASGFESNREFRG